MVLKEFQLDITPILTGAGIVGLAVVRRSDARARHHQRLLPDPREPGARRRRGRDQRHAGAGEAINLRTIVLRDIEGTVHVFPNGAINTLANRSKEYSYYVLDLGLSYDDSDLVADVLREIGAELQKETVCSSILEPIEILGIDAFGEWSARLKRASRPRR